MTRLKILAASLTLAVGLGVAAAPATALPAPAVSAPGVWSDAAVPTGVCTPAWGSIVLPICV